jgi:hypothetical protein
LAESPQLRLPLSGENKKEKIPVTKNLTPNSGFSLLKLNFLQKWPIKKNTAHYFFHSYRFFQVWLTYLLKLCYIMSMKDSGLNMEGDNDASSNGMARHLYSGDKPLATSLQNPQTP